jgi:hypothetical protein
MGRETFGITPEEGFTESQDQDGMSGGHVKASNLPDPESLSSITSTSEEALLTKMIRRALNGADSGGIRTKPQGVRHESYHRRHHYHHKNQNQRRRKYRYGGLGEDRISPSPGIDEDI